MDRIVSGKYAKALYDIALEENKLGIYEEEVRFIKEMFLKEKDILKVLSNPNVDSRDKKDLVSKLFGKAENNTVSFIKLMIDKNRSEYIIDSLDEFLKLIKIKNNILVATIISAKELSEDKVEKIGSILETKFKKQIELEVKVDESVIGGFLVKAEDYVFDMTINGKVEELKKKLNEVSFA
ncbi:MAG: ATP synthase F1 subunit delta [Clostridia bacterium]|jgi:F-type H+-transporting ATPase subunit delta|nr:ATP synthase F1 subunit delta [Clostridia bacterium]